MKRPPSQRTLDSANGKIVLTRTEMAALSWLCRKAAVGCEHDREPAWAAQLRAEADYWRREADAR